MADVPLWTWDASDGCYVYQDGLRMDRNGVVLAESSAIEDKEGPWPSPSTYSEVANSGAASPQASPTYAYHAQSTEPTQTFNYALSTTYTPQIEYLHVDASEAKTPIHEAVQTQTIDFQMPATPVDCTAITDPVLSATSQARAYASRRLLETSAEEERLDSRFRVRRPGSSFFKVGKIFKVLWPELAGDRNLGITIPPLNYGAQFALKIRWFVVIKQGQDCCSCLPIQTYGQRGVTRPSLVKGHHAIMYTSNEPNPRNEELLQHGEVGMLPSIRVRGKSRSDRLDPLSRVNFGKIYTVEHNAKVYDFGDVHPGYMSLLEHHFACVWGLPGSAYSVLVSQAADDSSGEEEARTSRRESRKGVKEEEARAAKEEQARVASEEEDKRHEEEGRLRETEEEEKRQLRARRAEEEQRAAKEKARILAEEDERSQLHSAQVKVNCDIETAEQTGEATDGTDRKASVQDDTMADVGGATYLSQEQYFHETDRDDSASGSDVSQNERAEDPGAFSSIADPADLGQSNTTTARSTNSSNGPDMANIHSLSENLMADPELKPLYAFVTATMTTEKFKSGFERLLRIFYEDLSADLPPPPNEIFRTSREFLGSKIPQLTKLMSDMCSSGQVPAVFAQLKLQKARPVMLERLLRNMALKDKTAVEPPTDDPGPAIEVDDLPQENDEEPDLRYSQVTKDFLFGGPAYTKFRRNFEQWLHPSNNQSSTKIFVDVVSTAEPPANSLEDSQEFAVKVGSSLPEPCTKDSTAPLLAPNSASFNNVERLMSIDSNYDADTYGIGKRASSTHTLSDSFEAKSKIVEEESGLMSSRPESSNASNTTKATSDNAEEANEVNIPIPPLSSSMLEGNNVAFDSLGSNTGQGHDDRLISPERWLSRLTRLEADIVSNSALGDYVDSLEDLEAIPQRPINVENQARISPWRRAGRLLRRLRFWKPRARENVFSITSAPGLRKCACRKTVSDEVSGGRCQAILQRVCQNFDALQVQGYCGQTLNILVADKTRPGVVKLMPIHVDQLSALRDCFLDSTEVRQEKCASFLSYLGLDNAAQQSTEDIEVEPHETAATVAYVLDMAMISYSGTHTESFDERYLGKRMSSFLVSRTVLLRRRSMRCLDPFLNGRQVWVFQSIGKCSTSSDNLTLALSTNVHELNDTWGPVWKRVSQDNANQVISYDIGVGHIVPWAGTADDPVSEENEILCHWTTDVERVLQSKGFPLTKDYDLLIGASQLPTLRQNRRCRRSTPQIGADLRGKDRLTYIGTCKSERLRDSRTVAVAIKPPFSPVTGTYSETYKLREPSLLRQAILAAWSNEPQARNPRIVLSGWLGVEISACCIPHTSRRALSKLLSLPTFRHYLQGYSFPWTSEYTAREYFESLASEDAERFIRLYEKDLKCREIFGDAMGRCIEALLQTKVDDDDMEGLWCSDRDTGVWIARFDRPRWGRIFEESATSCTVAVASERCVRLGHTVARDTDRSSPVLETYLSVSESALAKRPEGLVKLQTNSQRGRRPSLLLWDTSGTKLNEMFSLQSGRLRVTSRYTDGLQVEYQPWGPLDKVMNYLWPARKKEEVYHREGILWKPAHTAPIHMIVT